MTRHLALDQNSEYRVSTVECVLAGCSCIAEYCSNSKKDIALSELHTKAVSFVDRANRAVFAV